MTWGGVWYTGIRDTAGCTRVEKHVDDRAPEELAMRRDLACPPASAFEWGRYDAGSAQLALALCADVLGDEHGEAVCHKFKGSVVLGFPRPGFAITAGAIEAWARELQETCQVPSMPRDGVILFTELAMPPPRRGNGDEAEPE